MLYSLMLLLTFSQAQADYQPTADNKAVIARLEHYLTSIKTINASFTQEASNGDVSTGIFYLAKPGKLRMEYAPPTPILMVAKDGKIAYYDKELQQVSYISLDSSLVGFLARDKVTFDDSVTITHLSNSNQSISISIVQSKNPKDNTLTLEFSDNPLLLRNMIVKDSAGNITSVALNNARFNGVLDEDLFVFKDPNLGKKSGIKH